jgi:hypothetical protein
MACSLCENQVINKTPVYHESQGKPTRRGLRLFHSFRFGTIETAQKCRTEAV